ncbi:MAG: WG repeat-containing protein [Crocinitomicaceae bacterium]|nr:WG repeat-containing protein [Crocinitomicaceae bacterium]
MKYIATVLTLCLSVNLIFAQAIFKEDKSYGVSKLGTWPDDKEDSVMFRAEYEEIVALHTEGVTEFAFKALRNEEWMFLTPNRLINQQRYEEITIPGFVELYAVASREGYLDIIDLETSEFLIRGVKADALYNHNNDLDFDEILMTVVDKEFYGVINTESKKEILKAEYTSIKYNQEGISFYKYNTFIAFKDAVNYLYNIKGELLHKFEHDQVITSVSDYEKVDKGLKITVVGKKEDLVGFYDIEHKWYIPPVYHDFYCMFEGDPAVIVVSDGKSYGLFFEGKQILPCEYLEINKSDKQGYLGIAVTKKGSFYVSNDGRLLKKESE